MKVAYHFTIPRPPRPELDAAVQDALKLKEHFPGELNYLYPGQKALLYVPRFLCGLHQLSALAELDRCIDIHQIYSNGIYAYPILRWFKKPIIYSSVTGLRGPHPPWFPIWLRSVHTFVISNEMDKKILDRWGLSNVEVVYPAIDLSKFSYTPTPYPVESKFVLMAGSAPWSLEQFHSKGVNLLLSALKEIPDLHLILLWRGTLLAEIKKRVQHQGLADRVEIINKRVDVNRILARVHAGIVLAKKPDIVKAYPHSLLESLAAGKPVLVSSCLPMADYVKRTSCGEVVEGLRLDTVVSKLKHLRENFAFYQKNVLDLDLYKFSVEKLVDSYGKIYERIKDQ